MNKNIIIFVVALVAIFGFMAWQGGAQSASLPVQSQLEAKSLLTSETADYDLGTVSMKDGVITREYIVSNNTDEPVRVDSIVTSCMCTTAYLVNGEDKNGPFGMPGHGGTVPRANEVINPGEKRTVEVVFDPAAHGEAGAGRVERSIYLTDQSGAALELKFTANVTN
jgi:hypothetical protein